MRPCPRSMHLSARRERDAVPAARPRACTLVSTVNSTMHSTTMADASPNEISPGTLRERQERGERSVLLDVREQNEWNLFRIPNAIHIPVARVSTAATEALAQFPDEEVV